MHEHIPMEDFHLHPQLQQDCHQLGQLAGARLLLHRNAILPWFILVPETDQVEFLLLSGEHQARLMSTCSELASLLLEPLGCQRTNFAAIGNLVPQMHLHVVGRKQTDPCWPAPVWGNLSQSDVYTGQQLAELMVLLQERFPTMKPEVA